MNTEIYPQISRITQKNLKQMDKRDPRTYAIIGAAQTVHAELGCGFLEPVCQAALALELAERSVPFEREVDLPLSYKGRPLDVFYRADFVCFDSVIVELKAIRTLSGVEEAQVINYLKATGLQVGLLLNFGAASLEHRRLVLTRRTAASRAAILERAESATSAQSADSLK
jgi:GxxExxY protein